MLPIPCSAICAHFEQISSEQIFDRPAAPASTVVAATKIIAMNVDNFIVTSGYVACSCSIANVNSRMVLSIL